MTRQAAAALVTAAALVPVAATAEAAPAAARITCAGAISWKSAHGAVGRLVTVRGPVAGTKFASSSNGSPPFLDLGVAYPSPRRFTVVIWGRNRARFGAPERRYRGRTICARGRVTLYRGVPELEARSPAQIRVVR